MNMKQQSQQVGKRMLLLPFFIIFICFLSLLIFVIGLSFPTPILHANICREYKAQIENKKPQIRNHDNSCRYTQHEHLFNVEKACFCLSVSAKAKARHYSQSHVLYSYHGSCYSLVATSGYRKAFDRPLRVYHVLSLVHVNNTRENGGDWPIRQKATTTLEVTREISLRPRIINKGERNGVITKQRKQLGRCLHTIGTSAS